MFEKLGEELAKIFFVILAFVCGVALEYYVPQTATFVPIAWNYIKTVQNLHTDQNYYIRHVVSSPSPTP